MSRCAPSGLPSHSLHFPNQKKAARPDRLADGSVTGDKACWLRPNSKSNQFDAISVAVLLGFTRCACMHCFFLGARFRMHIKGCLVRIYINQNLIFDSNVQLQNCKKLNERNADFNKVLALLNGKDNVGKATRTRQNRFIRGGTRAVDHPGIQGTSIINVSGALQKCA